MSSRFVHLGFEVGGDPGHRSPVVIPIRHMAVTGQTQESGKTTTLEALITRSGLPAIAFLTKRGEASLHGRQILPYFQDRADWQFVQSILESTMKERMKFERAWIVRACRGARTLADVQANVEELQVKAKNALSQDVYMLLGEYLKKVVPLIASLPKANKVDLDTGLSVMDLVRYPEELQMLVISSTLEWIHKHAEGVITIIPEAWKFVPQGRNAPVKIIAEKLVREGAGLRNYLWIDSQDMAAVDKLLLRACAVWLIGVQREANEIKRALSSMPAGLKKPNAGDVATLDLGQFFACHGKEIRKAYVQPAWMDEKTASQIATGQLHVHDVTPPNTTTAQTAGVIRHRQGESPAGSPAIGLDSPDLDEPCKWCRETTHSTDEHFVYDSNASQTFAKEDAMPTDSSLIKTVRQAIQYLENKSPVIALQLLVEALEKPTDVSGNGSRSFTPQESFDNEALYQAFKKRLMEEDPALLLKVLAIRPAIEVQTQRRTVTINDDTIKGRLAMLIVDGFFDEPHSGSEAHKELLRRGLAPKTPSIRVYEALSDFRSMGFFYVSADKKYQTAPGAKVNVVAA